MKKKNRKTNNTYYFTVEGETEELYFKRLQSLINECEKTHSRISIRAKKEAEPKSFAKRYTSIYPIVVTHVIDRESEDEFHREKFSKILGEMREAESLHKEDCYDHKTYRKQYLTDVKKAYKKNFVDLDEFKKEQNLKDVLKQIELDDVIRAIERAKTIMRLNEEHYKPVTEFDYMYYTENPSLSIWESIELMLKECGVID